MRRVLSVVSSVLAAAIVCGACSGPDESPEVSSEIEAGKRSFVAFDFHTARDVFGAVLKEHPENPEAAYGYARTLMILNQFEEAVPAFERALQLAPNDPRVYEGHLYTLVWGGVLRGRRAWLDRGIEMGAEAIGAFPNRVTLYELVETAAAELNQPELWLQILKTLEPDLSNSSVFHVHQTSALLVQARSSGGDQLVTAIKRQLREELVAAAAADGEAVASGAPVDSGRRYMLAIGHKLLDDVEEERAWLARLDETPEGRRMGATTTHYDVHYMDFAQAQEAPPEERLEIIERWKRRFLPAWDTDDITIYRVPLSRELDVSIAWARKQREEEGQASAEVLDRIVAIGEDLVRLNTWGGAGGYRRVSSALVDLDARLDVALQLTGEGIARLEEGRAGMLYPGRRDDELDREREVWIASLERVRGQALAGMGRHSEAEEALRRSIEISPRSDRFASLGELLVEQERYEEAYEALVGALAHNAEDERIRDNADHIRELAVATAKHSGRDEATLDRDLETSRIEVAEEVRRQIVANRLDLDAPDFELTDTAGNEWRLSALRGKVVLLNFWATWCEPCRTELPHYQELVDEYFEADDVVFLAITTDTDHSAVRDFLDETDYRFTVLFDEGLSTDYQVTGIPRHFILGPEGRTQYVTSGFPGPERYVQETRLRIEALRVR